MIKSYPWVQKLSQEGRKLLEEWRALTKGVSSHKVAMAMTLTARGIDYRGCSKIQMAEHFCGAGSHGNFTKAMRASFREHLGPQPVTPPKKRIDIDQFLQDFQAGITAAQEATKNVEDGGSCNFDSAVLRVGKGCVLVRRSPKLEAAIMAAGLRARFYQHGVPGYHLGHGVPGQGGRRTLASETLYQHLKAKGYDMDMYYRLD